MPAGTADVVRARLAEPVDGPHDAEVLHRESGERCRSIARKLHVSKTDLAEANYMSVSTRVSAGQKLIVPREATVLMAARTDRPVPVAESRATVAEAGLLAAGGSSSNRVKATYEVKRGDTLASIASSFKTTVCRAPNWNPRLATMRLTPGAHITVYRLTN